MDTARIDALPRAARVARRWASRSATWLWLPVVISSWACSDDDPPVVDVNANGGSAGEEGTAGSGLDAGAAGAGVDPDAPAPGLRAAVTLEDDALAREALALLGSAAVGASGSCRTCHSIGRPTLTRWSQLTRDFVTDCLTDPTLSSQARIDAAYSCIERHATESTAFEAADFGIYAAAAHLPWFTYLFEHASTLPADRAAELERFVARVGMPRTGQRWTQAQFDTVAEWFARGTPQLFELVPEDAGEDCTAGLDPALATHVADMAVNGWRAKNEEVPLLMYGCEGAQRGAACLTDLPLARDEGANMNWDAVPGTRTVLLHDNSDSLSTYWSRSSADGRFIGSGLLDVNNSGFSGQILDLAENVSIDANFAYDATFFPDNSGFLLQQGAASGEGAPPDGSVGSDETALVCDQSVLAGDPGQLTGNENECVELRGEIGLYQQLAKAVDGDDYLVVHGAYESDDGGFFRPVLTNPSAAFDADSVQTLTPMINQGSGFESGTPIRVSTPRQGDPILSPSGRLLVTRIKGREVAGFIDGADVVTAEQSGYALYSLSATVGAGGNRAEIEDVGRVCLTGGKAVFSFDERWMVLHHYVTDEDATELGFSGADDPGFQDYTQLGASNLYLVDLLTGAARRITNTQPGQYALFPHFRSDGWIYFVVRTLDGNEYFVASDAALILESSGAEE